MALVEVDPVDDPLDRLVERGVVEDDVRRLSPELERQAFPGSGELALDRLADLRRARERDLVDAFVLDERRAGAAVAGDDVDDARRELGLAEDVGEEERGERRRLGRLEHDRVPGCERGRDLPGEHEQREVPRHDLAGDADRARLAVRERVLELVRPARVVEEVGGREREVDVARLADRLAAVHRLEDCELAGALLEDARDSEQVLRALRRRDRRPAVVERLARGSDGLVDLFRGRLPHLGEGLLARGVDRRVRLAGLEPVARDEEPVAVAELDEIASLGSGRVVPGGGDGSAVALSIELGHGSCRVADPPPTPHP